MDLFGQMELGGKHSARTRYLPSIGLVATFFLAIRANRLGIPTVMQNIAVIATSSNPTTSASSDVAFVGDPKPQ